MHDQDIQQRFHLMQKEIEATVSLMSEAKIDLTAAIDSLKIELEVLKIYMERYHPGFAESYPKFREEAIQAINPEWIGSEPGKRLGPNQVWVEGLNRRLGCDDVRRVRDEIGLKMRKLWHETSRDHGW